jgi:hypothetical protein
MKSFVPSSVVTLHRKMTRSLAHRGALGTAWRCLCKPGEVLWRCVRDALPEERQYRAAERDFDRNHNVDTRVQHDPGWMARIASPNWLHGIGYAPVPIYDMQKILAELPIDHREFAFVDMGAGKGRAILVAAEFPFKRIVGVEYCPKLAHIMQANIASYHNPRQRCHELEGIFRDATLYDLPSDPLVLFFHHPFETAIFLQVRERIVKALAAHPRRILIIYYDPQCQTVFEESPHFRVLQRSTPDERFVVRDDWVVYESLPITTPVEGS